VPEVEAFRDAHHEHGHEKGAVDPKGEEKKGGHENSHEE